MVEKVSEQGQQQQQVLMKDIALRMVLNLLSCLRRLASTPFLTFLFSSKISYFSLPLVSLI